MCMYAGRTRKAVIYELHPDTFEIMVKWIYGSEAFNMGLWQAVDVFIASDRFGIISLNSACCSIIYNGLWHLRNKHPISSVFVGPVEDLRQSALTIGSEVADVS